MARVSLRLQAGRLIVRDVAVADAERVAEIWADPQVTRYLGGPRDRAKVVESVLEAAANPPRLDLWTVEHDGKVIGSCGLLEKEIDGRDEVELIYVIAGAEQGRGFATEAATAVRDHAARAIGHSRLVALIDAENAPSLRVAEKLGFSHERDVERPGGRLMQLHARES